MFPNSFGKSHAGGQGTAARQRQRDFLGLQPRSRSLLHIRPYSSHLRCGTRMTIPTAKDAKCFDWLIDLANAAPVAAVYIELMPNQSPTLLSRRTKRKIELRQANL
jgi:hypothetical protein